MELRRLLCFLAVAEGLHFALAAERLHVEQSPLSRAIKEPEEDLGVVLFARTTSSARLTRAGTLVFGTCAPGIRGLAASTRQRASGRQRLSWPIARGAVGWHHTITLTGPVGAVWAGRT